MSDPEKPLHVRVAEALGWTGLAIDGITSDPYWWRGVRHKHGIRESVPYYDTDWEETGPLIEKYAIGILSYEHGKWNAATRHAIMGLGMGPTPLIAVCNLLLALSAARKLEP